LAVPWALPANGGMKAMGVLPDAAGQLRPVARGCLCTTTWPPVARVGGRAAIMTGSYRGCDV